MEAQPSALHLNMGRNSSRPARAAGASPSTPTPPRATARSGPRRARRPAASSAARRPATDSAADAARRARAKVRRYCAANRLNRLGTLTYAVTGCHDPTRAPARRRRVLPAAPAAARRAVPVPLGARVAPGGHGLHVHFAVGRFDRTRALIDAAWGHGLRPHQAARRPAGRLGVARRGPARRAVPLEVRRQGPRRAPGGGLHRYEVAQGFQPRGVPIDGLDGRTRCSTWAETYMGAPPERVWRSRDEEDWAGPPAVWASVGVTGRAEAARAWVERTCAAQGVPVKVRDPGGVARSRAARSVRRARRARPGRGRSGCGPGPPGRRPPGRGPRRRSRADGSAAGPPSASRRAAAVAHVAVDRGRLGQPADRGAWPASIRASIGFRAARYSGNVISRSP